MPKNKFYSYSSYSYSQTKQRSWLRIGLIAALIGLPLGLVVAEFAARGIFQVTGAANQVGTNTKEASVAQAYQLQMVDNNGKPYAITTDSGSLQVRRHPLLGYELVPNQTSKFWKINSQGFRQDQALSLEKPAGEIRIFILGGSTAFGSLATDNQATLAPKIETLLNSRLQEQTQQPEKFKPQVLPYFADQIEAMNALPDRIKEGKYRVITAAVPGYTSSNGLALLSQRIMAFNPDCIIFLGGYDDLRQEYFDPSLAREINYLEQLLQNPAEHYRLQLSTQFNDWVNSLYLTKAWQRWVIHPSSDTNQQFKANPLPSNSGELQTRIERYRYNLKQMVRLMGGAPVVAVLQPEITGKQSSLTNEENQILQSLGSDYSDRVAKSYGQLDPKALNKDIPNLKVVNFYRLYDNFNQTAFSDPINLTEAANDKLARSLAATLQEVFAIQPSAANSPTR